MSLSILIATVLIVSCNDRETLVDKNKLTGNDYRLFQNTPVWNLAKAVEDSDTVAINQEVSRDKTMLNFRESVWGQSILSIAVLNKNYISTKKLLEVGANPNLPDLVNGDSPLMDAANIGVYNDGDSRFLRLLLQFGGDPDLEQQSKERTKFTPLMIACRKGNLEYIKILIEAGAAINHVNEYGISALEEATLAAGAHHCPEIVSFLIKRGADYKRPLYQTVDGQKKYITDAMREWRFDLASPEYNEKMRLVAFLMENGMDYKKTLVPEEFINDYPKDYLEKY